jgi:hypothetical protein
MPVQTLSHIDPKQFFHRPSTDGAETQRLKTQVSGVAVSNHLSGRLSVTTAEGDRITLTADLAYDFRAIDYSSRVTAGSSTVGLDSTYVESTLKKKFGVTVEGDLSDQELNDIDNIFRKLSNIFRAFFKEKDEVYLTETAKLAARFGQLSSLSSLDLYVDIRRTVTGLAAQIASAVTGQPFVPSGQEPQIPTAPLTGSPGGTPVTEAVISPPSIGPMTPTPASSMAGSAEAIHVSAPAQDLPQPSSLAQQVLEALRDTRTESRIIRKYLPDFLDKLREDLVNELRGERERRGNNRAQPANQAPTETDIGTKFAYRAVNQTSVGLSIHG